MPACRCVRQQDNGENKLEYTAIFTQYVELVESTIETRLKKAVPGFDMTVSGDGGAALNSQQ